MRRIGLILASITVCFVWILGAFLVQPKTEYNPEEKRFAYIINPGTYYWQYAKDGIEAAGEALGCRVKECEFARYDIQEQIEQLRAAMYMKVDGIITVGEPYSDELNGVIAEIVESGIPVVLVDTDSPQSGRSIYIGTNNYEAGRLAARKIIEEMGESGEVAVFVSALSAANQLRRYSGFADELAQYPDVEIVEVREHHSDSIKDHIIQTLQAHPQLSAVFCAEASSSAQLGLLLEGDEELVVIGFDNGPTTTMKFVEEGIYTGTVVQSAFEMGYQAVEYLMHVQTEPVKESVHYTQARLVTAEDIKNGAAKE